MSIILGAGGGGGGGEGGAGAGLGRREVGSGGVGRALPLVRRVAAQKLPSLRGGGGVRKRGSISGVFLLFGRMLVDFRQNK